VAAQPVGGISDLQGDGGERRLTRADSSMISSNRCGPRVRLAVLVQSSDKSCRKNAMVRRVVEEAGKP
jgi:hypothetical protein